MSHPSNAVAHDLRTVRRVIKELIRLYRSWLPPQVVECMDAALDELGGEIDRIERAKAKLRTPGAPPVEPEPVNEREDCS